MKVIRSTAYTRYKLDSETSEQDVLAAAEGILGERLKRQGSIGSPTDANDFLRMRLGALSHEEFHILWLRRPPAFSSGRV
jgi:DNA repair protein RadC